MKTSMDLGFECHGKVKVSMISYVQEINKTFAKEVVPQPQLLLLQITYSKQDIWRRQNLLGEQVIQFHHTIAQLLFVITRASKDIQTAVAFLSMRVKSPDYNDWEKLRRAIKYLNGKNLNWYCQQTITLVCCCIIYNSWWLKRTYRLNFDIGVRGKNKFFNEIKINQKHLTGAELVGMDDAIPQILWTRYFMECQGYMIKENLVFHDNTSLIILEMNGKTSSTQRTKHTKVRYLLLRIEWMKER